MFNCQFCNKEAKNHNSFRNHQRLCKSNPDSKKVNMEKARAAALEKVNCIYCDKPYSKFNIKKHTATCGLNPFYVEENSKSCPVCDTLFMGRGTTCSHSCSNKLFRTGEKNGNWSGNNYRSVAKQHHEMKCIICSEDRIVAIHHMNEEHNDNRPQNLVPLCPTHHQYMHSRFKYLIIDEVESYINKFNTAISAVR